MPAGWLFWVCSPVCSVLFRVICSAQFWLINYLFLVGILFLDVSRICSWRYSGLEPKMSFDGVMNAKNTVPGLFLAFVKRHRRAHFGSDPIAL